MPIAAKLPPMMLECAVYAIAAGLMMKWISTKKLYADLYISLITAMLSGRMIAGIAKALIFARGDFAIAAWATSNFVTALPGIIIQLAFIPTIVFALMKANLVPQKYDISE